MTAYTVLIPAGLALGLGSWLSYNAAAKTHWAFLPGMALLGAFNVVLWGLAAKMSATPRQLYSMGCVWDGLTLFAYSILPLAVFGVRLSAMSWAGLVLVVIGILLVKAGEP